MSDFPKVRDIFLCFHCGQPGNPSNETYALECSHVMCVRCHYAKVLEPIQYAMYCSRCQQPRNINPTLTNELKQYLDDSTYFTHFRNQLDFTLAPCYRCDRGNPLPNCPFDHSDYTQSKKTVTKPEVEIEIKVCEKCNIRSEGVRCVRCKGGLKRMKIPQPRRLVIPQALVYPYGE